MHHAVAVSTCISSCLQDGAGLGMSGLGQMALVPSCCSPDLLCVYEPAASFSFAVWLLYGMTSGWSATQCLETTSTPPAKRL